MNEWRICAGIWVFGGGVDRFCTKGYSKILSTEEAIKKAGKVRDLSGVELYYPSSVNEDNLKSVKKVLEKNNLIVTSISLDLFSSEEWKHGAFTNSNRSQRQKAVQLGKEAVDIARELDCFQLGIWPGQDGFDYPFQADYEELWSREIEGIREVSEYAKEKDLRVGLEYKLKEPRRHMLVGTVGKALCLVKEIGLENLGVILDFGHALMSKENPGDSVVLLSRHKKLFGVHINDAYREWDDDMIVGTINFWETLEFLYWLKQVNYKGDIELDQFPFRQDAVEAASMSIQNIKTLTRLLDRIDLQELRETQKDMDITATQSIIRRVLGD